jgi:hypothetical protein
MMIAWSHELQNFASATVLNDDCFQCERPLQGKVLLRVLYFDPKTIFIPPPPFPKNMFFPLSRHFVFDSYCALFALILPHFAFPHFNPSPSFFSLPCSALSISLPPFFLFLSNFPHFSLHLFIFFLQSDIGWYTSLEGEGIFPCIDPWFSYLAISSRFDLFPTRARCSSSRIRSELSTSGSNIMQAYHRM